MKIASDDVIGDYWAKERQKERRDGMVVGEGVVPSATPRVETSRRALARQTLNTGVVQNLSTFQSGMGGTSAIDASKGAEAGDAHSVEVEATNHSARHKLQRSGTLKTMLKERKIRASTARTMINAASPTSPRSIARSATIAGSDEEAVVEKVEPESTVFEALPPGHKVLCFLNNSGAI